MFTREVKHSNASQRQSTWSQHIEKTLPSGNIRLDSDLSEEEILCQVPSVFKNSKKAGGSPPLDLTVFGEGNPSRNAESPLDLSLKTRKRCADSTAEFADLRALGGLYGFPPAKRLCGVPSSSFPQKTESADSNRSRHFAIGSSIQGPSLLPQTHPVSRAAHRSREAALYQSSQGQSESTSHRYHHHVPTSEHSKHGYGRYGQNSAQTSTSHHNSQQYGYSIQASRNPNVLCDTKSPNYVPSIQGQNQGHGQMYTSPRTLAARKQMPNLTQGYQKGSYSTYLGPEYPSVDVKNPFQEPTPDTQVQRSVHPEQSGNQMVHGKLYVSNTSENPMSPQSFPQSSLGTSSREISHSNMAAHTSIRERSDLAPNLIVSNVRDQLGTPSSATRDNSHSGGSLGYCDASKLYQYHGVQRHEMSSSGYRRYTPQQPSPLTRKTGEIPSQRSGNHTEHLQKLQQMYIKKQQSASQASLQMYSSTPQSPVSRARNPDGSRQHSLTYGVQERRGDVNNLFTPVQRCSPDSTNPMGQTRTLMRPPSLPTEVGSSVSVQLTSNHNQTQLCRSSDHDTYKQEMNDSVPRAMDVIKMTQNRIPMYPIPSQHHVQHSVHAATTPREELLKDLKPLSYPGMEVNIRKVERVPDPTPPLEAKHNRNTSDRKSIASQIFPTSVVTHAPAGSGRSIVKGTSGIESKRTLDIFNELINKELNKDSTDSGSASTPQQVTHVKPTDKITSNLDNVESQVKDGFMKSEDSSVKSESSADEEVAKFTLPLKIAIPGSGQGVASSQNTSRISEPRSVISKGNPKAVSRKQIILNAVKQDEDLKRIANLDTTCTSVIVSTSTKDSIAKFETPNTKSSSGSATPYSPPSPKMPILSPQEKRASPPPVSVPVCDPPTLDSAAGARNMTESLGMHLNKLINDAVKGIGAFAEDDDCSSGNLFENSIEGRFAPFPRGQTSGNRPFLGRQLSQSKNIPVANVAPFVHGTSLQKNSSKDQTLESLTDKSRINESPLKGGGSQEEKKLERSQETIKPPPPSNTSTVITAANVRTESKLTENYVQLSKMLKGDDQIDLTKSPTPTHRPFTEDRGPFSLMMGRKSSESPFSQERRSDSPFVKRKSPTLSTHSPSMNSKRLESPCLEEKGRFSNLFGRRGSDSSLGEEFGRFTPLSNEQGRSSPCLKKKMLQRHFAYNASNGHKKDIEFGDDVKMIPSPSPLVNTIPLSQSPLSRSNSSPICTLTNRNESPVTPVPVMKDQPGYIVQVEEISPEESSSEKDDLQVKGEVLFSSVVVPQERRVSLLEQYYLEEEVPVKNECCRSREASLSDQSTIDLDTEDRDLDTLLLDPQFPNNPLSSPEDRKSNISDSSHKSKTGRFKPKISNASNTRQKADKLRKRARQTAKSVTKAVIKQNRRQFHNLRKRANKQGFIDFKPEVLQTRTRHQSYGRRKSSKLRPRRHPNRLRHTSTGFTPTDGSVPHSPVKLPSRTFFLRRASSLQRKFGPTFPKGDSLSKKVCSIESSDNAAASAVGEPVRNKWEIKGTSTTLKQTLRSGRSKGGLMLKISRRNKNRRLLEQEEEIAEPDAEAGDEQKVDSPDSRPCKRPVAKKKRGFHFKQKYIFQRKRRSGKQRARILEGPSHTQVGGLWPNDVPQFEEESAFEDPHIEYGASDEYLDIPLEVRKLTVNKELGETLLHRAARVGKEEVALYCLATGSVDVNARDNAGYTPLHESCVRGDLIIARHLLENGADVNCCSQDGIRPIHDAVENDHVETVRLLLSYGADPSLSTYSGKTPLKIAKTDRMRKFIEDYLADLNGKQETEQHSIWRFPTSSSILGPERDDGCPVFTDLPSDPEDETEDMCDIYSKPVFNPYRTTADGFKRPDDYFILSDILDGYKISRAELDDLGVQALILRTVARDKLCESIKDSMFFERFTKAELDQNVCVVRCVDATQIIAKLDFFVMQRRLKESSLASTSSENFEGDLNEKTKFKPATTPESCKSKTPKGHKLNPGIHHATSQSVDLVTCPTSEAELKHRRSELKYKKEKRTHKTPQGHREHKLPEAEEDKLGSYSRRKLDITPYSEDELSSFVGSRKVVRHSSPSSVPRKERSATRNKYGTNSSLDVGPGSSKPKRSSSHGDKIVHQDHYKRSHSQKRHSKNELHEQVNIHPDDEHFLRDGKNVRSNREFSNFDRDDNNQINDETRVHGRQGRLTVHTEDEHLLRDGKHVLVHQKNLNIHPDDEHFLRTGKHVRVRREHLNVHPDDEHLLRGAKQSKSRRERLHSNSDNEHMLRDGKHVPSRQERLDIHSDDEHLLRDGKHVHIPHESKRVHLHGQGKHSYRPTSSTYVPTKEMQQDHSIQQEKGKLVRKDSPRRCSEKGRSQLGKGSSRTQLAHGEHKIKYFPHKSKKNKYNSDEKAKQSHGNESDNRSQEKRVLKMSKSKHSRDRYHGPDKSPRYLVEEDEQTSGVSDFSLKTGNTPDDFYAFPDSEDSNDSFAHLKSWS